MAEVEPRELPAALCHARRHLAAAEAEWRAGKLPAVAVDLREALVDTAWALYTLWASEHDFPATRRSE